PTSTPLPTFTPTPVRDVVFSNGDIELMSSSGGGIIGLGGSQANSTSWSPDGTRICFGYYSNGNEIAVVNSDGTGFVQISNDPGIDYAPHWGWNGSIVYFTNSFPTGLYKMESDGSGVVQIPIPNSLHLNSEGASLSPDGSKVAFSGSYTLSSGLEGISRIFLMGTDGSGLAPV